MKKLVLLSLSFLVLFSCNKDFGSIEVTYTKATAIYGNLEEIRNAPLLEIAKPIANPGKIFVAENILLIGEEGEGIHIVDNTDPANPTNLSFLNIPNNREFFVDGNTLYAESLYDMLKIDISNKDQPRIISRVNNAFANEIKNGIGESLVNFKFEEVTEKVREDSDIRQQMWGERNFLFMDFAQNIIPRSQVPISFAGNSSASNGTVNRIAAYKDHVYVISRSNITTFIDEGNSLIKSGDPLRTFSNMETIYPDNNRLYIGTQQSMEVYSLNDPANPQFSSSFSHATSCDPVLPCGDVAFVTLRTGDLGGCPGDENALLVLGIENINSLSEIQEIQMESPYGMTFSNNKLYVGEGSNGLKIFDATEKSNLVLENWDKSIEAYDIIHHPTNPSLLLIAGPTGISQYEIEGGEEYKLLSTLTF